MSPSLAKPLKPHISAGGVLVRYAHPEDSVTALQNLEETLSLIGAKMIDDIIHLPYRYCTCSPSTTKCTFNAQYGFWAVRF
jgi:hypothetical protein